MLIDEPITLIESASIIPPLQPERVAAQTHPLPQPQFDIVRIKKQIESIKMKNQARKKQLHELFSFSYDEIDISTDGNKPKTRKYMDTITERRIIRGEASVETSKARNKLVQRQRILNNNNPQSLSNGFASRRNHCILKTARHFPQTLETESRSHRYSQSKEIISVNQRALSRCTPRLYTKRKLKVVSIKTKSDINTYRQRLKILKEVYDHQMSLIKCVRGSTHAIERTIYGYIDGVNCLEMQFIDKFIDDMESSVEKTLKLSRALENLTVIFLALEAMKGQISIENEGHIINLIGHAAANTILLSKLFMMSYTFQDQSVTKTKFEESILIFQRESYGEELTDFEDILTRIQHNNEILMMVQSKVGRSHPQFELKVKHFLKTLQRGGYAASQIFYFLFEYLACYLHTKGLINLLPSLDTAPRPFLPQSTKPFTIIIDPVNVLVYQRHSKFYLRSYTSQFLEFIDAYCQIILWTAYLPTEFEEVLDLIDSERRVKYKLYRYHCLHVNYFIKQHGVDYVKDVRMLGRDLTNLMILDSNAVNFSLTPSHGIVLNWNGSERDRKLMDLCQILTDMFKDVQIDVTQNIPVEELIGSRSAEIDNLQNAKAKIRRRVR